jgi:hypothetical protein
MTVAIEKVVRGYLDATGTPRFDDLHMIIFDPDVTNTERGDRTALAVLSAPMYATASLIERLQTQILTRFPSWRISIDFESLHNDHVIIYPNHYHLLCKGTELGINPPFEKWMQVACARRRQTHGAHLRQLMWLEKYLPELLPKTVGRKFTCLTVFDNNRGDFDWLSAWSLLRCKSWQVKFPDECLAGSPELYYFHNDLDFADAPVGKGDFDAPPLYLAQWIIRRPEGGRVTVTDAKDDQAVLVEIAVDQSLITDGELRGEFAWDEHG